MQGNDRNEQMDKVEIVTEEAQPTVLKGAIGTADMQGNPVGTKPEDQVAAKPKKSAKKPAELGKGMTIAQMEAKRDEVKAEAKSWTDAIDRRKRVERLKEEKAKREKEQRDALEFYRKYKLHIEISKVMTLTSGKTFFERIEEELAKGKKGQEG